MIYLRTIRDNNQINNFNVDLISKISSNYYYYDGKYRPKLLINKTSFTGVEEYHVDVNKPMNNSYLSNVLKYIPLTVDKEEDKKGKDIALKIANKCMEKILRYIQILKQDNIDDAVIEVNTKFEVTCEQINGNKGE